MEPPPGRPDPVASGDAPSPSAVPPASPATPPRRWDWRPKLRWFAAEIVVVVAGVLIALALNAWWGARQHADREEALLRQIVVDLQETERLMLRTDGNAAERAQANAHLLRAFSSAEVPPTDSLFEWLVLAQSRQSPPPFLSSIETLLSGGDRVLTEAPELRFEISLYLAKALYRVNAQNRALEEFSEARRRIEEIVDDAEIVRAVTPPQVLDSLAATDPYFVDAPGDRVAFPIDPEVLVRDREMYNALRTMHNAHRVLRSCRRLWREWSVELRGQIEAHLDA